MSTPTPVPAAAAPAALEAAAPAAPAPDTTDSLLAQLKAILTTAGHDVGGVWDEAVALAKKLV